MLTGGGEETERDEPKKRVLSGRTTRRTTASRVELMFGACAGGADTAPPGARCPFAAERCSGGAEHWVVLVDIITDCTAVAWDMSAGWAASDSCVALLECKASSSSGGGCTSKGALTEINTFLVLSEAILGPPLR